MYFYFLDCKGIRNSNDEWKKKANINEGNKSSEPFELLLEVLNFSEKLQLFLFYFKLMSLSHFWFFYLVLLVNYFFFPSETLDQNLCFLIAFLWRNPWIKKLSFQTVISRL